ncbi:hypothetical protein [Sphingosinicella sp. BN140058]|uniref:hypothetical protein n=1 Tax=Sphingosinicella sp. BN140058 TaxID=1892855 RepID=UPI00101337C8|nr:hypothetical protein [Sphingosinicella sp. BN140058]QAY80258.1 hypothetical protein ETR14_26810 [Sphingosinicella sp. BN140058]
MLQKLQQLAIGLHAQGDARELVQSVRRLFIGAGNLARKPAELVQAIKGMAEISALHEAETGSWVDPDVVAAGEGGAFDACDLRHWLALAERAGVSYIPTREILRLEEDEIGLVSGTIAPPPSTPATRRLRASATAIAEAFPDAAPAAAAPLNGEAIHERLFAAMDDVPEGWMVRSNRCGGGELKSLAGLGAIGDRTPEVRFGPTLEVGPGWVRVGNRRQVNCRDMRTIQAAAQGPGFLAFLARPWIEASRYIEAPDPHREGSPFAGKGIWPAEWRAFVENGEVIGVSSYYGWTDAASPETARTALAVRALAQRIVDEALRQRAFPRYPDIELVRSAPWVLAKEELNHKINVVFGRESVSCTLDFLETAAGPVLLEGGPPASPIGGGHPCAFAGVAGKPTIGNAPATVGVAFRTMPHVLVADPSTWDKGDPSGCILSWEEVEALAAADGHGAGAAD